MCMFKQYTIVNFVELYVHRTTVNIPYKMKYWQGVNFGDWRLLDKIANI